ncbi:MAG: Ig-like domain-containing protein, partial [Myxococcota bacterium]
MTSKKSTSVLGALLLVVMTWGLSGCALYEDLEPINPDDVAPESIVISPSSTTIELGGTTQLSATVFGPNDLELEDRQVEWMSSNSDRATVTSAGVVEGIAAGTVTITARVEDVSDTAQVEVVVPIDSVTIDPETAQLDVGQTEQFTATVVDVLGNEVDTSIVEWTSSREDVASIDGSGLVEGMKEGTTTITARARDKSATATVVVTASVANVDVSPNPAQVALDDTTQLTATVEDANGNELSGRDVAWESSDETIATVNSNGIVTGVSEGDVDITATSEGESGTALVQVTRPVATVSVTPDPVTLDVAETEQLSAVARDANGDEIQLNADAFRWRSGDQSIATVTGTGLVEGTGEGTVQVTAEVDGVSDGSEITVNRPVVSIEISPEVATVDVNSTVQLTATLLDANGDVISGRSVNWTSSNSNTASVDDTGTVTGHQEGDVVITARAEGVSATADITVGAPVDSVTVSPDGGAIEVADTLQLDASLQDAGGNTLQRPVTWSSSDPAVASVDDSGLVTGESEGTAQITAESEGVTDTVTVDVTAPVANVTISPDPVNLDLNGTQQLSAELLDANSNVLTGRTVTWSSSDSSVATVDSSGLVTAQSQGTTQVTATSEGVTDTVDVTVTSSVDSVVVTPDTPRIYADGSVQLSVEVLDANGDPLTGRTVTWSSSETGVATVDSAGLVTAVGPGEAT